MTYQKKIFISMFIQSCLMLLYFIKTVYFRCYIPPADMILKKIPAADKNRNSKVCLSSFRSWSIRSNLKRQELKEHFQFDVYSTMFNATLLY